MTNKNDTRIKELKAKVEEQKVKLGKKPRATFLTNAVFNDENGGPSPVNLNVLRSKEDIVKFAAKLVGLQSNHEKACNLLDIDIIPLVVSRYPVSDWLEDVKTRVKIIEFEENQKKLDATQAKLDQLLSEDAKTELALEDIEKSFK
jgi:hypothetical protein